MAKQNSKDWDKALSDALDDVLKDWKSSLGVAVEYAVKEAKQDYEEKAHSCLQEYYDYYDPTKRYTRTETLQHAFLPYMTIKYKKDKIEGEVGIEYSPELLEQFIGEPKTFKDKDGITKISHTGYYGSQKHQPVDAWWVIDNYLRGVHPVTNGGYTPETSVYHEEIDPISPNEKMEAFRVTYGKNFDENILLGLLAQVSKKIK